VPPLVIAETSVAGTTTGVTQNNWRLPVTVPPVTSQSALLVQPIGWQVPLVVPLVEQTVPLNTPRSSVAETFPGGLQSRSVVHGLVHVPVVVLHVDSTFSVDTAHWASVTQVPTAAQRCEVVSQV
jgi:hypothetical protein